MIKVQLAYFIYIIIYISIENISLLNRKLNISTPSHVIFVLVIVKYTNKSVYVCVRRRILVHPQQSSIHEPTL